MVYSLRSTVNMVTVVRNKKVIIGNLYSEIFEEFS